MRCKTKFILSIIFVLIFSNVFAQVKGVVADETGPLPGVNVLIVGTSSGTETDFDGRFELQNAKIGDQLEFSYIGLETQRVTINSTSEDLLIKMISSSMQIDEVVLLGYSSKKRSEISSSVVVLDDSKLNDVPSNDIGGLLQGKVAGVQVIQSSGEPGAASQVRIRGISSISSEDAEPLYVVDGVIGGSFDPNDVASITVLKDAGTTAMYGSRANNGVIVVQTKTGKLGKTVFEFKSNIGIKDADHGNVRMMNGKEFYNWSAEQYRDPVMHEIDLVHFFDAYPRELSNKNYNWVDKAFSPSLFQKNYLSAKGSTEKLSYYISGSYTNDEGTFMDTGYQGLNFRTNTTYRFNDGVTMKNNVTVNTSRGDSYDYMDMMYAYLGVPWDQPFNADGSPRYVDGDTEGWLSKDEINPFHNAENTRHNFHGFGATYDMNLKFKLTDWLSFRTTNRIGMYTDKGHNYISPLAAGTHHNKGYVLDERNLGYEGITTNIFDLKKKINAHSITGLVGYEFSKDYWEASHIEGSGIPVGLEVPSVASTVLDVKGDNGTGAMESFLSQISYNYNNKYFLSASYRADAASNFPETNRIGYFPGVSASWLVSNESFMKDSWMNLLKIRTSYGVTGDPNIGQNQFLGLFRLSSHYNGNTAAIPTQVENLDLTWEKKHQVNFGLDIGFFERVNLTLDLYKNTTKDLILRMPQPLSQGFEYRYENNGEIENKGFEVSLSTINFDKENFKWTTDFNFSQNTNILLGIKTPFQITINGISQIYRNEVELYTFYLPKWLGVNADTGAPEWEKLEQDADGNILSRAATSNYSEATYQEVGHALPDFTGGFTSDLEIYNFTLYANLTYQYGNDIYNFTRVSMDNDGNEPYYNNMNPKPEWSRWEKPGDIATHPSMQNNALSNNPSSRFLEKGDFIKLRTLSLHYKVPTKWVLKSKLKGITVGVTANNLFTFTNYWGQDPEVNIERNEWAMPGVSDFKYPNNKQFLFNLNVKF